MAWECWFISNSLAKKKKSTKLKFPEIWFFVLFTAVSLVTRPCLTHILHKWWLVNDRILDDNCKIFYEWKFLHKSFESIELFSIWEKLALSLNCWQWIRWVDKNNYENTGWKNLRNFPNARNKDSEKRKAI